MRNTIRKYQMAIIVTGVIAILFGFIMGWVIELGMERYNPFIVPTLTPSTTVYQFTKTQIPTQSNTPTFTVEPTQISTVTINPPIETLTFTASASLETQTPIQKTPSLISTP